MRCYLKNTYSKKAGGIVAQVVEYLPGKHKALTSNSRTAKKKRK
jgi:hypothetical protein